jgi:hypothetical protein
MEIDDLIKHFCNVFKKTRITSFSVVVVYLLIRVADPDPLVIGMDPDPSIIMHKYP